MASTKNRSGTDASKLASVMPSRKGYREDCGTSYLLYGRVPEWPMGVALKANVPACIRLVGSNPTPVAKCDG